MVKVSKLSSLNFLLYIFRVPLAKRVKSSFKNNHQIERLFKIENIFTVCVVLLEELL
jgi:hypothetical protein